MRFCRPYAATPSRTAAKRCNTCQAACPSLPTKQCILAPSERCTDPMGSRGQPYSHCMESMLMHPLTAALTVLVSFPVTIPPRDGPGRLDRQAARLADIMRWCATSLAAVRPQPFSRPLPLRRQRGSPAQAARGTGGQRACCLIAMRSERLGAHMLAKHRTVCV